MAKKNGKNAAKKGGGLMAQVDRWLQPWHRPETQWPAVMQSGPAIEVKENGTAVTVIAEMPGLEKDDFNLEMDEHRLILRGEKKMEREEKDENYHFTERSFGSFYRAIPLPCAVDSEHVKAAYKQGVLTVSLPKAEAAATTPVKVEVS